MSQTDEKRPVSPPEPAPEPSRTRRIPPPSGAREPLKANVFERMAEASCQLLPLFPYLDAGAMLPCGAIFNGEPDDGEFGHFFHWNTAEEVVVAYGSHDAMMRTGQIFASQKLHGVNSYLRDPRDAEAFTVATVTQHQAEDGDQEEAIIFRCQQCHELLLRFDYDATPRGVQGYLPAQWGGTAEDEIPMFSTIWGSAAAAARYRDESVRTCAKCGHVNAEHPEPKWGWQRWVDQTRTAERSKAAMRAAAKQTEAEAV